MMTIDESNERVRSLFGPGVAVVTSRGAGDQTTLLPAETACAMTFGAKRSAEYAAGRTCARAALRQLGLHEVGALPTRSDRRAMWPAGFVGSITHSRDICGVVVADSSAFVALGIDVEHRGRIERELWPKLFVPSELADLARRFDRDADVSATIRFSAKEAFYKCRFELTRGWLDFTDVVLDVSPPDDAGNGSFIARLVTPDRFPELDALHGRFAILAETVWTGIAIAPAIARRVDR